MIGLGDKNKFNASHPQDDLANFATYVTDPTLPVILNIFSVIAPPTIRATTWWRTLRDRIDGLNAIGLGEMQRLNTNIPPTPKGEQSNLGVIGGDNAGFPTVGVPATTWSTSPCG